MDFREFYDSGKSLDGVFRHEVLSACLKAVTDKKEDILSYLSQDLGAKKPDCMLYYYSLLEGPLKTAVVTSVNALKPTLIAPKAPNIVSLARMLYEPYGVVMIEPDRRMPFLHSYGVFLMSLAVGNSTVFRFRGRETSTALLVKDITNRCLPEGFGKIFFADDGSSGISPDLTLGGFDYSSDYDETRIGRVVAVFDALSELDRSAEQLVFAWKKASCLTEAAPEMVLIPTAVREVFVKNFNKWHRRRCGFEAPVRLPIIGYDSEEALWKLLEQERRPAALYVFAGDKSLRERLTVEIPFVNGCVNGTTLRSPDLREMKDCLLKEKTHTVKVENLTHF